MSFGKQRSAKTTGLELFLGPLAEFSNELGFAHPPPFDI
jgi:hypothetical protein